MIGYTYTRLPQLVRSRLPPSNCLQKQPSPPASAAAFVCSSSISFFFTPPHMAYIPVEELLWLNNFRLTAVIYDLPPSSAFCICRKIPSKKTDCFLSCQPPAVIGVLWDGVMAHRFRRWRSINMVNIINRLIASLLNNVQVRNYIKEQRGNELWLEIEDHPITSPFSRA